MAGPQSSREVVSSPDNPTGFLQCETFSGLAPSTLSNGIHSAWARPKFHPQFDYDRIKVPLRLATRMLETALPAFHSILCGKIEPLIDVDGRLPCFSFPDPLKELTAAQKQETWDRISVLTNPLLYYLESEDDGCNGSCLSSDEYAFKPAANFSGIVCEIHMSKPLIYQPLIDACSDKADMVQRQYWQFGLAVTLIHELTHTAHRAVTPHDGHFFLGRQGQTSEMGFEMEAWLFGGVPPGRSSPHSCAYRYAETGKYSKLPYQITMKDYPCPALYEAHDITHRSYASRINGSNTVCSWNTEFPHINEMFQDHFWNYDIQLRGRQALFFIRKTGMMSRLNEELHLCPVVPHPDETFDIPAGFWLNKNGLIQRKVNKLMKIEVSHTRQFERQIHINKIVATGVTQTDWKPLSLGEKTEAWKRKVTKEIGEKAANMPTLVREMTQETTKKVWEKSQQTTKKDKAKAAGSIQSRGGTWELTEMNLRVAGNMLRGKGL